MLRILFFHVPFFAPLLLRSAPCMQVYKGSSSRLPLNKQTHRELSSICSRPVSSADEFASAPVLVSVCKVELWQQASQQSQASGKLQQASDLNEGQDARGSQQDKRIKQKRCNQTN
eukprot:30626_2